YFGSLGTSAATPLEGLETSVTYSPAGYLLFARASTLTAQPFDPDRLKLTGAPVAVADHVGVDAHPFWVRGWFSVSRNGVLAYRNAVSSDGRLAWLGRSRRRLANVGQPGAYGDRVLSPDGTWVAGAL